MNKPHLIEYAERFADFVLGVRVFHFSRHHGEELWEIDGSISCGEESHSNAMFMASYGTTSFHEVRSSLELFHRNIFFPMSES